MKNYFLISEFAKLRGININSLRYYEKIGILKPAYIDEKTGYRYYSPEQVSVLNKIILCIQLGIPLKEMVQYIDEEGNLQSQKLLEQGKRVALKRIEEMQNNLKYIETSLNNIETGKVFAEKKGIYNRYIRKRYIILTEYYEESMEIKEMVSEVAKIYKTAQKNDWFPILPAGQLLEFVDERKIRMRSFVEILNYTETDSDIICLPEGEYTCMQLELNPALNLEEKIRSNWKINPGDIYILDNMMLEKYSFETRPTELQHLKKGIS